MNHHARYRSLAARLAMIAPVLIASQSALSAPPATALALEDAIVEAIAKAERSVVGVARIKPPRGGDPLPMAQRGLPPLVRQQQQDPDNPEFIPNDFGAGIVFAPEGRPNERLILTNYHVVRGGPAVGQNAAEYRLYLRFPNRRGCYAEIVAADPRSDLAVLLPDFAGLGTPPRDIVPIEFADPSRIRKGRFVIALGNPYAIARDGSASASWGIIANIARRPVAFDMLDVRTDLRRETVHHLGTLLQIDARLEFGTSGGALVDLEGRLQGITTPLAAIEGYEKSAGYAIPLDEPLRRIIRTLADGYEVEYGFLGVTPATLLPNDLRQRYSHRFDQPTAAIAASVMENAPAAGLSGQRGLLSGDVILAVSDRPISEPDAPGRVIRDRNDLMREIALLPPGTTAHLLVWRESARRMLHLEVKLGKWPPHDDEGIIATRRRREPWRGLVVDYSTARRQYMPLNEYYPAALATEVAPGSSAARADIQPGAFITHVNGVAVRNPDEFHEAVAGLSGPVSLTILDRGRVTVPE